MLPKGVYFVRNIIGVLTCGVEHRTLELRAKLSLLYYPSSSYPTLKERRWLLKREPYHSPLERCISLFFSLSNAGNIVSQPGNTLV